MRWQPDMKRLVLKFSIAVLLFSELYLCSNFFPGKWQASIQNTVSQVLPRKNHKPDITHPAIDQEIQQALRDNPPLRMAAYGFLLLLIVLNTFLLIACWKTLQNVNNSI